MTVADIKKADIIAQLYNQILPLNRINCYYLNIISL